MSVLRSKSLWFATGSTESSYPQLYRRKGCLRSVHHSTFCIVLLHWNKQLIFSFANFDLCSRHKKSSHFSAAGYLPIRRYEHRPSKTSIVSVKGSKSRERLDLRDGSEGMSNNEVEVLSWVPSMSPSSHWRSSSVPTPRTSTRDSGPERRRSRTGRNVHKRLQTPFRFCRIRLNQEESLVWKYNYSGERCVTEPFPGTSEQLTHSFSS